MDTQTLIIGVGGAGANISVNINKELNYDLLLVNIDDTSLEKHENKNTVHIDIKPTQISEHSAALATAFQKAELAIVKHMEAKKSIIIIAGLGGKAGTYICPKIIELAKNYTSNINFVCTLPFLFEGKRRELALETLTRIKTDAAVKTIDFDNHSLAKNKNMNLVEAFEIANQTIVKSLHHEFVS